MSTSVVAAAHRVPRRVLLLGAIAAAAAVAVVSISTPATTQAAPNVEPIKAAINGALVSQQVAALPPASQGSRALLAADVQTVSARGRSDMAKYFGKDELTRRDAVLDQRLERQATGDIRYLAGGVSRTVITSLNTCANGVPPVLPGSSGPPATPLPCDYAVATVEADVWLDIAQVQPDGSLVVAHPKNTMLFTLQLQLINGSWLVVDEESKYAPGSEP